MCLTVVKVKTSQRSDSVASAAEYKIRGFDPLKLCVLLKSLLALKKFALNCMLSALT